MDGPRRAPHDFGRTWQVARTERRLCAFGHTGRTAYFVRPLSPESHPETMIARFPRLLGVLALLAFALPVFAQGTPVGTWRTIDDETGEPKSTVRIYESGGQLVGDIQGLLPRGRRCEGCAGRFNNSTLEGVRILEGFTRDGDTWSGGRITDPKSGKTYKAKMKVERDGRLRVWGYVGVDTPVTRRNQRWERVR